MRELLLGPNCLSRRSSKIIVIFKKYKTFSVLIYSFIIFIIHVTNNFVFQNGDLCKRSKQIISSTKKKLSVCVEKRKEFKYITKSICRYSLSLNNLM